jgi:hypothetical protein
MYVFLDRIRYIRWLDFHVRQLSLVDSKSKDSKSLA